MNRRGIPRMARLFAVAAGLLAAGASWGAEFWLRAGVANVTMPDARVVTVWGLANDAAGPGTGSITVPGPSLMVAAGDSLTIHLTNTLPEPVSLVIPGQYSYQSLAPVFHSGDAYDGRVRSLAAEAAPLTGTADYVWTSLQAGTYLLHSGSHPSVQVQMGLYAPLTVVAPGPEVYSGVPYNSEVTLLLSEIDPDVHDAVSSGSFGPGPQFFAQDFPDPAGFVAAVSGSADPAAQLVAGALSPAAASDAGVLASDLNTLIGGSSIFDVVIFSEAILSDATIAALISYPEVNQPVTDVYLNGYMMRLNRLLLQDGFATAGLLIPAVNQMTSTIRSYPQYFLVNGQPYTPGQLPVNAGAAGSTVLVRLLNAGMDARSMTLNNGGDLSLIGEDGQQAPYARNTAVVWLPALKTIDALWTAPAAGVYTLFDRRLGLVSGLLTPGGDYATLSVGAAGVASGAPAILVPPASQIAFVGQSATFSVIATHVGTPTYQWQQNGLPISGAVAASYTINPVSAASLGDYTVVVTDGTFSTTSPAATLTVVTQPVQTPVPVIDFQAVTLSVTDLGPGAPTYQWLKDGAPIAGATAASYAFTANYATDNGHTYSVVAAGAGAPATSSGVVLAITPVAPAIVTQPADATVPDFATATFTVVATGSALTYQWQRSANLNGGPASFANIAGATAATYAFTVHYAADNNTRYQVIVSGPGGPSVTSSSATLTVTPVGPQILTQPADTVTNYGVAASLTVVAQATGALGYQWQKLVGANWVNVSNGSGISGATTSTLAFNGTATTNLGNSGTYRVIVSSTGLGAGSVTSNSALFTINPASLLITSQPASVVVNAFSGPVTFTVVAVGYPAPTYRWQRFNGTAWVDLSNGGGGNGGGGGFSGVTTATLTVASAQTLTVAFAGSYRVNVTNATGTVTSTPATLTITQTFTGASITQIDPLNGGAGVPNPRTSASVPAFTGGSVRKVVVGLTLTHAEPYDVNCLLTTPGTNPARKVQFMGGLGPFQQPFETVVNNVNVSSLYSYPVTNLHITFDDAAPTPVSPLYPLYDGTFQPTVTTPVVAFPAPAPNLPYATTFGGFNGFVQTTAGGWRLFVNDVPQDIPVPDGTPNGRISSWTMTLTVGAAPQPPAFVQVAASPVQASAASVSVPFTNVQAVGNLNVVIVGWRDITRTVNTVTDTNGNTYQLAIGPTTSTLGGLRQSIYYASNIAAGANAVTVTFTGGAATRPDVRILEYSNATALDQTRGASGTATTASSGSGTIIEAPELIVGASMTATTTTGPGTSFTTRIITPAPNSDIAEDRVVQSTGSYSATAPMSGTTATRRWVMQMATFRR
jgi:FtsP/CotA-like multicopper oxidase with cupredoxin domain